jgi:CheY-like chemotaxis protein
MPLSGLRVLVVEDHDDSRDVLEQALTYAGAAVTAAASAKAALESVDTVDVVVTDIAMPGHDGLWLLDEIRRRERRIPVIALSGYSDAYVERLAQATFDRVLRKPVDPWILADEIAAVARTD